MYPVVRVMSGKSQREIEEENKAFAELEQRQKKKALEDNAARMNSIAAEHAEPLLFGAAVRNRNFAHDNLKAYRDKTREELQIIYSEYINLCQRRGMPLSSEDQDFGRLYLENLLSTPTTTEPQKPSRPWLFLR